ncbi:hypothetical protein EZJ49_14575 [Bdellovibrio bacteriovorus]|uniref:hypothetical protein n=1 Tax=Bdellovibrio bacteriovorus TaxID=959 RepID=UPI0021D2DFE9|nr:hypothetical protein [Bdellovibrio bacteriovorus]UXR64290.1 hypothetical protein EZJ49_14575 [Bdellovibrio bacteriovorus]
MKKIVLSLLIILPSVSWSHDHNHDANLLGKSPVTAASVAALELFESGNIGGLIGFQTFFSGNESAVKLTYQDESSTTRVVGYDCHFHAHDDEFESHCHDSADLGIIDSAENNIQWGADEFIAALSYSADIFSRKIAPLPEITGVKMWQTHGDIWVSLSHLSANAEVKSHFMCHMHGDHFDCHRSRNPGPHEPRYQD